MTDNRLGQQDLFPIDMSGFKTATCSIEDARIFISEHHSRLPYTQRGPWMVAFGCWVDGTMIGAALWHNTSARGLPSNWLELRRLAICQNAPHCSASKMIGQMVRWIKNNKKEVVRLISYQDLCVHTGTIYKASGWIPTYISKPRNRDRSRQRTENVSRKYRTDSNGKDVASAPKIRWEKSLDGTDLVPLQSHEISMVLSRWENNSLPRSK